MTDRPGPRLGIIGTSNSAGRASYAGHLLRSGLFADIVNLSLGFCSSDLFAFRRPELDPGALDLCLLDFACNDAALLARGALDARRIRHALASAASELTSAGCLPVLMILPQEGHMPDGGAVRRIYAAVAADHALPFLDGYAFLRRLLAAGPEAGPLDLFKDRMHVSDAVAALLGELLAPALHRLWWDGPVDRAAVARAAPGLARRFIPVADCLPDHPRASRATAMVKAEVARLVGPAEAVLRLPPGSRPTGLVADFARSRGVLHLAGDALTRLDLTTRSYTDDPAARMTLGIYPFQPVVTAPDGTLRLALVAGGGADAHVAGRPVPLQEGAAPSLTFAGLVVQEPVAALPIRRMLPAALELSGWMDEAALAEGRRRIGPRRETAALGKLGY
jgi:hypothetical protein